MQKKSLLSLIGLLVLALFLVLAHRLLPGLLSVPAQTLALSNCNLQRDVCVLNLPDGQPLSLSITPRPIPLMQPLSVDVVLGKPADKVAIEFTGVKMEMGQNRTELALTAPGHYRGSASLPVCTTGRMEWQANLLIEQEGRRLIQPFRFFAPDKP